MTTGISKVVATAVAVVGVLVADWWLAPVPVPAATVVAGGLVAVWLGGLGRRHRMVSGLAVGLALGVGWHLFVHLTGQSPEPIEGVVAHLALDGGRGLAVGLAILVPVVWIASRGRRGSGGA